MSLSSLKRPASDMESDKELRWDLARLLGVKVSSIGSIRKTVDQKISVIDVTMAVTGKKECSRSLRGHPRYRKEARRSVRKTRTLPFQRTGAT